MNLHLLCDKIQDFLNTKIGEEIVKKHNVDLKYNKLDLKNELIISRGLFLAKKQYAIHVIQQESKTVDENVYMGIAVKRSDFPSESKEFLKELLDMVLKSEEINIPIITSFINRKKGEFIKLINEGSKTIAKPVSFAKKLETYKKVPQGVVSMINFNLLFYEVHTTGTKAYLFKIKGIDREKAPKEIIDNYEKNFVAKNRKLEVIAIPDEEQKWPSYFIPDMKAALKFSFVDRYEQILKPLFQVKEDKLKQSMII